MEQNKTNSVPRFHKLTPLSDADIAVYADALDFVFEHDDIRNVAVSGPYGAGKSSVLETYKKRTSKKRTSKKFLHISLADFKSYSPPKSNESDQTSKGESGCNTASVKRDVPKNGTKQAVCAFERSQTSDNSAGKTSELVLEGKILNQLLHQISPGRIPQTGFRVKKKVTNCRVLADMMGIVVFIGLTLYQLFFQQWNSFVSALESDWIFRNLAWTTVNSIRLLLLIIEGGIFAWGVGYLVRKQRTTGILKKVSLQGNEFEIGQENDESLFDKYLNEVLYLFENADADVIVFEDLDRHESSDIFTRLREVNTLVNKHRPNKPLRFFYLLRDDIFTTKDRAKFFDFIIPIVPVLDASNAYDKFLEFFKQGGIADLFTPRFLQGLSLYIDEMRILKNIINEFQVYNLRLNTIDLDSDKLLALITYKNIFPKDFSDLQLNRGFVHELFKSKPTFVSVQKSQIGKQISELETQIEQAGYAFLSDNEIDLAINHFSRYSTNRSLVEKLNQAKEFYAAKVKSKQESTSERIHEFRETLARLDCARLCDVLSRDNIDAVFFGNQHVDGNKELAKFEEIKGSDYFDLLKFLLRHGYIDEGYSDYMTYFYPESLSRNDKVFLRSVADKRAKDWRYPLDDPKKVIRRLSPADFEQLETLNFSLLNAVLSSSSDYNELTKRLLVQLKAGSNTEFVNDFLDVACEALQSFVKTVNTEWTEFFKAALADAAFLPEHRTLWARTTLCVSWNEVIKAVNHEDCLRMFIAETPEFLDGIPIDRTKLILGMQLIGVEMKAISREKADADLLQAVYEHNLYALNAENVVLMLNVFHDEIGMKKLGTRSYSIILKKPESPLTVRVLSSMNDYLDIVFQECGGQIEDDQKDAISLLNDETVSSERKSRYIALVETGIESLKIITDKTVWPELLKHRKVPCSLENIVCYFAEHDNSIDDVLASFINNGNQQNIDFSDQTVFEDDDQQSIFFDAVVECFNLENDRYEAILKPIELFYTELNSTEVPVEKVRILVKLGTIEMSLESLVHMREHYPEVLTAFILTEFDKYLELIPNHLGEGETHTILNCSDFDDEQKIRLLQTTGESISIQELKCSDTVILHVLAHNLSKDDIPYLVKRYAEVSSAIQAQIVTCLGAHVSRLVDEQISLPLPLLDGLIHKPELSGENKVQLFAVSLDKITDDSSCQAYLNRLGLSELAKVFNNGRPKVEDSKVNALILDHFKKQNWIKEYTQDPVNSGFLKITKQKQSDD